MQECRRSSASTRRQLLVGQIGIKNYFCVLVSDCHKRCFLYVILDLSVGMATVIGRVEKTSFGRDAKGDRTLQYCLGGTCIYFSSEVEQTWRSYLSK